MIRGWAVRDNVNQIDPTDGTWLFNSPASWSFTMAAHRT